MSRRLSAVAPIAASLLAHGVLVAGILGAGAAGDSPPRPASAPVLVKRAPDAPSGPALSLVDPGDPAVAPGAAGGDAAVPLDTPDPRYRPYLAAVRERIMRRWEAPELPAGRPARGGLVVEFAIARDGRLAAAAVREGSGEPGLDRSALAAVERAGPFAPLPAGIAGERLRVRARFVYD